MPGALRRDPEAGGRGGAHQLGDLVGERRVGDGGRVVVDPQVPGPPCVVVRRVAGQVTAPPQSRRRSAGPAERAGSGDGRVMALLPDEVDVSVPSAHLRIT